MTDTFKDIAKALLEDMTKAAKAVMINNGVERNSDLIKSTEYEYKNEAFILFANDYWKYVSTGRRPNARKVPIEDLIQWIKEKNISPTGEQTINQLAFAIQTSIYKSGIKGHNYILKVENVSLDVSEKGILDVMEKGIIDVMQKTFNVKIS